MDEVKNNSVYDFKKFGYKCKVTAIAERLLGWNKFLKTTRNSHIFTVIQSEIIFLWLRYHRRKISIFSQTEIA